MPTFKFTCPVSASAGAWSLMSYTPASMALVQSLTQPPLSTARHREVYDASIPLRRFRRRMLAFRDRNGHLIQFGALYVSPRIRGVEGWGAPESSGSVARGSARYDEGLAQACATAVQRVDQTSLAHPICELKPQVHPEGCGLNCTCRLQRRNAHNSVRVWCRLFTLFKLHTSVGRAHIAAFSV